MAKRRNRSIGKCLITGKAQYRSGKAARAAIRALNTRFSSDNGPLKRAYQCHVDGDTSQGCGYWHLTKMKNHPPKKEN